MAAPALCRAFSQNAWRRDLCSNCFRSKDEHKAAAAARQKTPSDAARLAATAAVKSILKGTSKLSNSSGKKSRSAVSFHKEESQVIGYGGDDEIHSEEEGNDLEEVESPMEGDVEREKADQHELERLTKANTDFNSVIANLQLESITQEKQTAVKSSASGIPVPGGRSPYTGPLRLGLGSKDGDGNKKTLLVSVRPFGSDVEEVSKPVVKTKIIVTNGYGNGISAVGSTRESKDSVKPLVNGNMTNGYGHSPSTTSKEASVKVNVPSSSGNESKSLVTNGMNSIQKDSNIPRVTGNSDTTQISHNSVNGNCDENGIKISEDYEDAKPSPVSGEKVSGEDVTQNVKSNSMITTNSKTAVPVPANRSLNQQINSGSGSSFSSKSEDEKNLTCDSKKIVNGYESDPSSKSTLPKEGGISLQNKEVLNVKSKHQTPLISPSSNIPLTSALDHCEGSRPATDGDIEQHAPVPAERNILLSKSESPLEESVMPLNEAAVSSKENGLAEQGEQQKEISQAESTTGSPLEGWQRSSSGPLSTGEIQEVTSVANERINGCNAEATNVKSNILPSFQMSLSQPPKKNSLSRSIVTKQESQQSVKKPEEEPSVSKTSLSTKSSNNTVVTTSQKPASLVKRPAPSILKMGVPTGWHSKNTSQKNPALIHPGKDSNEEKIMSERANVVNGIIKSQPSPGTNVGQEKPTKPVNTIAKLRANFVNNNLKIIAESAAKIVNGTRYGTKNVVADEIPISKSSVMNLSMRPISTNSRTNKTFHVDDYELKDQRVKGLSNLEKVSNSFPSIRAKGSGPDIRELLRTPEKENESIDFQAKTINQKNPVETGVLSAKKIRPNDLEDIEQLSKEITQCSNEKEIKKDGSKKEHMTESNYQEVMSKRRNDAVSESSEKAGGQIAGENLIPGDGSKLRESLNSTNELGLMQPSPQMKDESDKCRREQSEGKSESIKGGECGASSTLQVSSEGTEDGLKAESPIKAENGLDKTPHGEKNRKKGIVRRILFKGGNEIYRKAGEMVRSVRRSNESKDDTESARDSEVKDAKDLVLISKKPLNSKIQGDTHIMAELTAHSEVNVPVSAVIEEAINPVLTGIGGGLHEIPKLENTTTGTVSAEGNVKKESNPLKSLEAVEGKVPLVTEEGSERTTSIVKPTHTVLDSSQPPVMSPRPSFLHGKSSTTQPWSLQSPARNIAGNPSAHNTPGARSERAASVSAVMSTHSLATPGGQRGRLSSLPASESEGRALSTNHNPQGTLVTLRKPGPIISGVKPAIPAKPSKILEASAARQGVNQQLCKPVGERKGSTTMSTPGSVGRSAGKRQAPKPPGMDSSQKRKCESSEVVGCQKEIITSSVGGGVCNASLPSNNIGNLPEVSQDEKQIENSAETSIEIAAEDRMEGSKNECALTLSDGTPEEDFEGCAQNQASQLFNVSNGGEEEIIDDLASTPRGTHFVKNQALNASKSSSRVARETERRQMLIQLQSSSNRGPVPLPDGSSEVPNSILQATSNTALSARQRSASLGRGVGVASPRPPLPGGSLGRAAGEGAALSIVTTNDIESTPDANPELGMHEDALSHPTSPAASSPASDTSNIVENCAHSTASPVRSRSEGSLAVHLPGTPGNDANLPLGAMVFEMPGGGSMMAKGEELIYDTPSGLSAKKKRHTVRGFLKFLRRGSLRDDPNGTGYENREELSVDSEPKTRPVIVHPMELDGACVEVVKGGGIDVRRRLEEESALEMFKNGESGAGGCSASSEQSQSSPRRPTSISIAPPRPPPVMHSPSSPSLSSSSSSSSGSTPIRPRPPPPPRGLAPVPPSPGGSGQKPARPPPPKPAHLMRLGLIDREVPGGAAKNNGDGIYANLGEVRATLAPSKPQRTASMREVLGSVSGKANGEAPTPRITPRNPLVSSGNAETANSTASSHCSDVKTESSSDTARNLASTPADSVPSLKVGDENLKKAEDIEALKSDKLSWSVGAGVSIAAPAGAPSAVGGQVDIGTDSSSEEENSTAPPLPLAPPPSLPPPLPLHPPPSPPSHATSSSSSSSIGNALILPEDSGYESVEFHGTHDSEVSTGRWWADSGIATSRGSVVTATTDSLEESYEAVVGANHRALADVLAQVCQPNPEEFGANTTLRWSDFLVEGPKGGVLRSVGPISFHRAALKGRASASGRDSWRRVTLGISASSAVDLPQYFRGCMCHDGNSAPIIRCMPSLRPMCTFQDEIPNRFFSSETGSGSTEVADLIEATVMVFNPLHLYSLKTYLMELITERKFGQSFPPLPEETNWCNRACLFLLVLLDTLCSLECNGSEDALCVIREESKPSPVVAAVDGQLADGSHLACPLPRLCVLPNENSQKVIGGSPSPAQCFQSVVVQIAEATGRGDCNMDSFSHVLNCIQGLLQGADDVLVRSRAALELWFFGPPIFHGVALHSPGDKVQEEIVDAREAARWSIKSPVLSVGETEPLSVEGELQHATPRRWLDLERAGALRSLAVSALHRGNRIPSPLESGFEGSSAEEGVGIVGKCCRGWRVGEIGGHPTLPTCEEVRLRFLAGTSGSEVAEAWELLARNELSSPTSVASLGRTYVDTPMRKLTTWTISSGPEMGEAQCQ